MSADGFIYLNNAATSWPKPPGVVQALADAVSDLPGAANRGGIEDFDVMEAVRLELAALLGVRDPNRFALGANATWALNMAIFGLGLKPGDSVLTTKAEHNSVLRPLYELSQRGIEVHYLDTNERGCIRHDYWTAALENHQPKLAVFSHASNVTGVINDVPGLVLEAHDFDTTVLIDMAQSAGWCPVALEDWGVDMATFTGHKYLLGPQGTGALYVRKDLELAPHLLGGTGIHSDMDTMPDEMPLHLEAGTGNEPSFYGLLAALKWAHKNPVAAEYDRLHNLLESLKLGLEALGAVVIDPYLNEWCRSLGPASTPVLSFTLPHIAPHDVGEELLDSYDIIVRTGLHCAPKIFECLGVNPAEGTVRVSLSRFTTQDDVDIFLTAMADIVNSIGAD